MGELTDKIKGNANEAAGKIKSGIGDATDNHDLEAEGKSQALSATTSDLYLP